MKILVLNCGSSSLKYQLFACTPNLETIATGLIDRIGQHGYVKNHEEAVEKTLQTLKKQKHIQEFHDIQIVGHRVVHGGEKYTQPTLINAQVISQIQKLCRLAPLHNPPNLDGIRASKKILPKALQIAVFDTAFHQTMPPKAYLYAIPAQLYTKHHIRRYGFHGLSHSYVSKETIKILKRGKNSRNSPKKIKKIITIHLGNGSSIAAIQDGRSIDTSMGYTPLEGLPMGTRSGDIDPAIPLIIQKKLGLSLQKTDELLNHASGLKALSGFSSDMRDLWKAASAKKLSPKTKQARLAITLLAYKIAKYIGSYAAALNGIEAITFTGGMGEKAWYLRKNVCDYLSFLGVKIDNTANRANKAIITTPTSKIPVLVIPTNEEKEIATAIFHLLKTKNI